VVRFWVNVVRGAGAGFDFFQFIRGGGVEEVAEAFLTFVSDGIGGNVIGRMKERLGEGKWAEFSAATTEDLTSLHDLKGSQVVSGEVFGVAVFSGELGLDGGCMVHVV
jgi:hypothetical protein